MPVQELMAGWSPEPPEAVASVADGLTYRDFITVGVLLKRLRLGGGADAANLAEKVPDNWIYIQEPDVKVGRIQIFNNWSPYLVAESGDIWIGLEYFVNEGDEFWNMEDGDMVRLAHEELEKLGFSDPDDVKDSVVVRTKKAYPAYFGSYDRFDEIRDYTLNFANLYCVGRNGMHRYNNQDHSMLTAMVAVDGIVDGVDTREALWSINTEQEYHEDRESE
jgi:protoporphyrinogen oxidase